MTILRPHWGVRKGSTENEAYSDLNCLTYSDPVLWLVHHLCAGPECTRMFWNTSPGSGMSWRERSQGLSQVKRLSVSCEKYNLCEKVFLREALRNFLFLSGLASSEKRFDNLKPTTTKLYSGLKKLSDLHYRTAYGALPIIYKLPDPAQIFGPKAIIRLYPTKQKLSKIIRPSKVIQCGLTFLHCLNFLRMTTFDNFSKCPLTWIVALPHPLPPPSPPPQKKNIFKAVS